MSQATTKEPDRSFAELCDDLANRDSASPEARKIAARLRDAVEEGRL